MLLFRIRSELDKALAIEQDRKVALWHQEQIGKATSFLKLQAPRVADPVHFRPDPDPANQNFKFQIRILLALTKNQFKLLNFFHIKHISSDI